MRHLKIKKIKNKIKIKKLFCVSGLCISDLNEKLLLEKNLSAI